MQWCRGVGRAGGDIAVKQGLSGLMTHHEHELRGELVAAEHDQPTAKADEGEDHLVRLWASRCSRPQGLLPAGILFKLSIMVAAAGWMVRFWVHTALSTATFGTRVINIKTGLAASIHTAISLAHMLDKFEGVKQKRKERPTCN
ncbi:hypothetical protein LTR36_004837 [Oleoguttula mirabilis]|uniref:Uncharacterized protein n=1 Tax=Oleoguttula mirabilis TaxID=1507867 RepID=A0AAV9JG61_9PEZI|nr:hypothetical protein LTR36_004837 [Oleoguttula mirabilis]